MTECVMCHQPVDMDLSVALTGAKDAITELDELVAARGLTGHAYLQTAMGAVTKVGSEHWTIYGTYHQWNESGVHPVHVGCLMDHEYEIEQDRQMMRAAEGADMDALHAEQQAVREGWEPTYDEPPHVWPV